MTVVDRYLEFVEIVSEEPKKTNGALIEEDPPSSSLQSNTAPTPKTTIPKTASLKPSDITKLVPSPSQPLISTPNASPQISSKHGPSLISRNATPAFVPPSLRSRRAPPPKPSIVSHAQLSALQSSVLSNISLSQESTQSNVGVSVIPTHTLKLSKVNSLQICFVW